MTLSAGGKNCRPIESERSGRVGDRALYGELVDITISALLC